MNKSKEYKIALVLYTSGLDYDDRIRKEIISVQKLYPNVKFKIIAVEPNNREEEGITSYGVPYYIPYLKSRDKYPSSSHTTAKAWDFYKTVKPKLKQFDAIWCADEQTLFFVLFLTGKPMLWDMHELPSMLVRKWWKRLLFRYAERKLRVVVHANEPRLDYLESIGMIRYPGKHFVLHNYPDFNEIDNEYDDQYYKFENWLGGSKCVYLQGLTRAERADYESISAVLDVNGLKAVVVGPTSQSLRERLVVQYGEALVSDRLYFAGKIKQLKTPQYIRKCVLSLVFYKNTSKNNWYCEPNRLFQSLINGVPVIVGNNPPLKEIVDNYNVGICTDTDGSDKDKIVNAINEALSSLSTLKRNLIASEGSWMWSAQEGELCNMIGELLL